MVIEETAAVLAPQAADGNNINASNSVDNRADVNETIMGERASAPPASAVPSLNNGASTVAAQDVASTHRDDVSNISNSSAIVMAQDPPPLQQEDDNTVLPENVDGTTSNVQVPNSPGYDYPTSNYYPTFPANVPTLARYDSGIFGANTSESEDDDEEDDGEDFGKSEGSDVMNRARLNSSGLNSSGVSEEEEDDDNSSFVGDLEDMIEDIQQQNQADMSRRDESGTITGGPTKVSSSEKKMMASSAPELLSGLPVTHKPFQAKKKEETPDYGYISTQPKNNIPLSTLPIDALHTTSQYCTPSDWSALSSCSKTWRGIGSEVFSKVWRHAGRCMVEVGVAWARGEHADARELASLYISKGVPIYPTPHGHSYHSIVWRMGLELDAMNPSAGENGEGDGNNNDNGNRANANNNINGGNANRNLGNRQGNDDGGENNANPATDAFYTERYVDSNRPDHHTNSFFSRNHMTYVEEKSLYWKKKKGIEVQAPAPQSRGPLFPRRFSFGNNNPLPAARAAAGLGGGMAAARAAAADAGLVPPNDEGLQNTANGWVVVDDNDTAAAVAGANAGAGIGGAAAAGGIGGMAAGGIGLARPPPLPASAAPGTAATMPIGGGGDAAAAGAGENAAAGVDTASRGPPRYARRSSFSGSSTNNPLLGERNPSSPNLLSLQQSMGSGASGMHPSASSNDLSTLGGYRNTMATAAVSAPKMTLRIHRHLADQHFFGSPSVNDENGTMGAGKMSMNADFFHPTWEGRRGVTLGNDNNRIDNWDGYWDGTGWRASQPDVGNTVNNTMENNILMPASFEDRVRAVAAAANGETMRIGGPGGAEAVNDIGDTVGRHPELNEALAEAAANRGAPIDENRRQMDDNYRAAVRAFVNWTLANADRQRRNSLPASAGGARGAGGHPLSMAGMGPSLWSRHVQSSPEDSPAADVHLEVYSSSTASPKSDEDDNDAKAMAMAEMHKRCATYQQKLDSLLSSESTNKFNTFELQEVLLDFWDELFPTTAGIHFYNTQSPVPRMSRLHTFLTTPTPKAVGTVQCEIERVKVSSKKKGAKRVKGRFFPSYEYRLFIRDTKNDNPYASVNGRSRCPPRKDSVLLVAKNKSSKNRNIASNGGGNNAGRGSGVGGIDFATPAGLGSPSTGTGGSKRGVTNYYMCLPQQRDVDNHFRSANKGNANANLSSGETSGLLVSPLATKSDQTPIEVGRLQSNFIGTEFQIFVPTKTALDARATRSDATNSNNAQDTSDDGNIEGDSRVHPIETSVPPTSNNPVRRMSRRGSGLVRLARRASANLARRGSIGRRGSESGNNFPVVDQEEQPEGTPPSRRGSKKAIRRMSWGNSTANKPKSRRAIANNSDSLSDYDLYNSGHSSSNPNAGVSMGEIENGAITYTANLLGNRPRIMDVCIPKLSEDGSVCEEWNGNQQESPSASVYGSGTANNGTGTTSMLDRFKTIQQGMSNMEDNTGPMNNDNNNDNNNNNNVQNAINNNGDADGDNNNNNAANSSNNHGLMILQNRPPWWNIELGAFVLNFGGRVKVASVKNFQLCERNDQDHVMQFGRIEGRHAFTMDFQHPLTPMQAFAIAISSLQSKISFG